MANTLSKNGKAHVLEISNRASVQKLNAQDAAGIAAALDNHMSGLNVNAHQIGNIAGLADALDAKQDAIVGYNGVLSVVTAVNFGSSTVTNKSITIENGIITDIS
jgi:hypothetical protein